MDTPVDFWEFKVDYDRAGDFELNTLEIDPESGDAEQFTFLEEEPEYPTDVFNDMDSKISSELDGFGLQTYLFLNSAEQRMDRYIMIYGDEPFTWSVDTSELARIIGFDDVSSSSVQSSWGGTTIHHTEAPAPFKGAFAAPRKNFIWCRVSPDKIQSVSRPLSGPPVTVQRGRYEKVDVQYRYVPGAMVLVDLMERDNLRTTAWLERDDHNYYQLENLWDQLSAGRSGREVRVAPRVQSRVSTAQNFDHEDDPFPPDYTDDVVEDVYFRGDNYFDSIDLLIESTQDETGSQSYTVSFEVYTDA